MSRLISLGTIAGGLLALASIAANTGEAASAEIRKGPYLQALGQKGVTLKLELSTPEKASIEITGPNGFKATKEADSEKRFHALRIDGLSPGTTYKYEVKGPGITAPAVEFTTAPADDKPFKFVVYGDSRSDAATHAAIARALEKAPADFFLHTGDMVASGDNEAQWQELFSIESKLLANRCVYVAVGNHELTAPDPTGEVSFLKYFGPTEEDGRARPHLYGSFRWSNTRFFLLNAMDTWTGEEKAWLQAELASAMNEPGLLHRIAVLHHGPFSSGRHGGNARLHSNGIVSMMRDNKVDMIFAGHDHAYERGEGQGLKYIISGGAGAPLYSRDNRAPETQVFESVHHFLEVAVDGDTLKVVARRASGSLIETCSYKGQDPWSCTVGEGKTAAKGGEKADESSAVAKAPTQAASSACACSAVGSPVGSSGGAFALGLGVLGLFGLLSRSRRA